MNEIYTRVEILRQAFSNSLTLEATNRLLRLSGERELYSKNKREAICIFCLNNGLGIKKCNELLEKYNEVTLE